MAPLIWFALDFLASTNLLSSAHTGQMLHALFRLLHIHPAHFDLLHHLLRKLGHFSAYAVLGWLLFRAWRATLPQRSPRIVPGAQATACGRRGWVEPLWTLRWSVLAVLVAVLVAAFDEFHQHFVPSRGADVRDVALDGMGALFMQLVLMLILLDKTRPAQNQP